jgi:hypothetical protein
VPILRARGVVRADYERTTVREHYRLRAPASQVS